LAFSDKDLGSEQLQVRAGARRLIVFEGQLASLEQDLSLQAWVDFAPKKLLPIAASGAPYQILE